MALEVVEASADGPLTATLLERTGQDAYTRTGRVLQVGWGPETPILMGRREDVRAGAVVQVRGRILGADQLDADRLVVLSGVVAVH